MEHGQPTSHPYSQNQFQSSNLFKNTPLVVSLVTCLIVLLLANKYAYIQAGRLMKLWKCACLVPFLIIAEAPPWNMMIKDPPPSPRGQGACTYINILKGWQLPPPSIYVKPNTTSIKFGKKVVQKVQNLREGVTRTRKYGISVLKLILPVLSVNYSHFMISMFLELVHIGNSRIC